MFPYATGYIFAPILKKWKRLLPPGEIHRVAVWDNLYDIPINRDGIITNRIDIGIEDAKNGVVFEKVRGLLYTTSVIDDYNIKRRVFPAMPAPQEVPSNSPKSIDGHLQLCLHNPPLVLASTNLDYTNYAPEKQVIKTFRIFRIKTIYFGITVATITWSERFLITEIQLFQISARSALLASGKCSPIDWLL